MQHYEGILDGSACIGGSEESRCPNGTYSVSLGFKLTLQRILPHLKAVLAAL